MSLVSYKGAFSCKNPDCNEQIKQYPCTYCGFKPDVPRNGIISEGYQ